MSEQIGREKRVLCLIRSVTRLRQLTRRARPPRHPLQQKVKNVHKNTKLAEVSCWVKTCPLCSHCGGGVSNCLLFDECEARLRPSLHSDEIDFGRTVRRHSGSVDTSPGDGVGHIPPPHTHTQIGQVLPWDKTFPREGRKRLGTGTQPRLPDTQDWEATICQNSGLLFLQHESN